MSLVRGLGRDPSSRSQRGGRGESRLAGEAVFLVAFAGLGLRATKAGCFGQCLAGHVRLAISRPAEGLYLAGFHKAKDSAAGQARLRRCLIDGHEIFWRRTVDYRVKLSQSVANRSRSFRIGSQVGEAWQVGRLGRHTCVVKSSTA